jgi:hypothetical protein
MSRRAGACALLCVVSLLGLSRAMYAQTPTASEGRQLYNQLNDFKLGGGAIQAENLVLQRDRGTITFSSGMIYFETPIDGKHCGAIFIGQGTFHADPPAAKFERDNVKRMIHADNIESDFQTAVLRFTDDTYETLTKGARIAGASPSGDAQKLAEEFDGRFTKETGANIPARLTIGILDNDQPGFFLAQFDKGRRGRFTFLFDPQGRVPSNTFGINGGEKGMVIAYNSAFYETDVWMAFYSLDDYKSGQIEFSDVFDQVAIRRHDLDMDAHEPEHWIRYDDHMQVEALKDGLRAFPLIVDSGLDSYDNERVKYGMQLKSVKSGDGQPVDGIQEASENGLTIIFPKPLAKGQKVDLTIRMEGEYMINDGHAFVPRNDSWYLQHGYLQRSAYRIVFHHSKRYSPETLGKRVKDAEGSDSGNVVTEYDMETAVPFIKFSIADYKRYQTQTKIGDKTIPIEFDSLGDAMGPGVKADFIGAEMSNALNYYSALFGPYQYDELHAAFHGAPYGQGMATFLLLPAASDAQEFTYQFLSHEVAHQWWGDVVSWRSYRDQWLSEGFAQYSSYLYTGQRSSGHNRQDLISRSREKLRLPPVGVSGGVQKGRVVDIGPIILGERLDNRETLNGYETLIYEKGAMILRMLHFLFSDPTTGDDKPFFQMMSDFVKAHQGQSSSTEAFMAMASDRFTATPIARRYNLKNLDWFFQEWVYSAGMPSYRLEYHFEPQPDNTVMLKGTLFQDDIPEGEQWFMPLPLVLTYGKDKIARGTVAALGPKTPINVKLLLEPNKVELDPEMFVLSGKTTASKEH